MGKLNAELPIGIFDSGVGGLTVLKSLLAQFPNENFLYLGDTARLPYGNKSPEIIRTYAEQCMRFLILQNVKCIVIACNSASSQFQDNEFMNTMVENVIEHGAKSAIAKSEGRIGVLGTKATIQSGVYEKTLQRLALQAEKSIEIICQPAPLFVPLAEEGWLEDPITNLIAYRYLQPLLQQQIDTLILGCTHYPVLRHAIQKVVGTNVKLIDAGSSLSESLAKKIPLNEKGTGQIDLLTTDSSNSLLAMARSILQNKEINSLQVVQI